MISAQKQLQLSRENQGRIALVPEGINVEQCTAGLGRAIRSQVRHGGTIRGRGDKIQ
jgi:hypothetical protein